MNVQHVISLFTQQHFHISVKYLRKKFTTQFLSANQSSPSVIDATANLSVGDINYATDDINFATGDINFAISDINSATDCNERQVTIL